MEKKKFKYIIIYNWWNIKNSTNDLYSTNRMFKRQAGEGVEEKENGKKLNVILGHIETFSLKITTPIERRSRTCFLVNTTNSPTTNNKYEQ